MARAKVTAPEGALFKSSTNKWPAQAVELVLITDLIRNARNARTHSDDQVKLLAAGMLEYGFTVPVLRDETNTILAGHGRVLAAEANLAAGHPEFQLVPCITARGWTDAQKRAYVIADNQLALRSGWDLEKLSAELGQLQGVGVDLASLAFTSADLRRIMGGGGLTDPDAAPPVPAVPTTKPGDLYVLGDHRLICGDSTDAGVVDQLLAGAEPHLMVTDPPYGVEYDPTWRDQFQKATKRNGKVLNDDRVDWRLAWDLFPGAVAYVWHADRHASAVQVSLEAAGFEIRSQIIWAKDRFVFSRGNYHWRHEPCWYAVRSGRTAQWTGGRKNDTVWTLKGIEDPGLHKAVLEVLEEVGAESTLWEIPISVDDGATRHGTQKPVECMRRPIENNSREGDSVYEPFCGSGTTVIAAEMTARRCFAVELDPGYCDVIVQRWEAFTGKTADRQRG
jgi:DNA modification methylase